MRLLSGALLVLALLSLPAAPTSAAPEFTCQGRAATVVGEVGRSVRGTDGDDVIVTNGAKHVSAGAGNDLICTTRPAGTAWRVVSANAGAGDDVLVWTVPGQKRFRGSYIDLGTGADSFTGAGSDDFVEANGAEPDVIRTGGGQNQVEISGTDPFAGQVELGSGVGWLILESTSMAPTAQLDGGGAGGLAFVAGAGETVAIDNGARTARVGEETRFTWTGFIGFSVRGGTVTFEGTDADESVRGYLRSATMGAGDDVASTMRSDGGPTLLATAIDGGAGHDLLRVSGGQFAETTDPRRVEIDVSTGRATADWHGIDFRDFEAFHAYVEGTAVIRGSSGDDELSGTACDLEIRGDGGADRITTDSNPDELYCDGPVSTRLVGGPGDDFIRTTQYFYGGTVLAGPGDDVVIGGRGADVVDAGPGADLVRGDQGPDDIRGGPGDDRLRGGAEDDVVRGGAGRDTCTAEVERSCERS